MLNKFFKLSIMLLLGLNVAFAEENKQSSMPENWWQMGSYEYEATDEILTHFTGKLGYIKKSGNFDEDNFKATVSAKIRREHLGLEVTYSLDKEKKIELADKDTELTSIEVDDYSVRTVLLYDLTKDFFVSGGFENSRNISFEMYNKTAIYAGVGYRALKLKDHKLGIFAAYGTEDISFGNYPILPSGETNGQYYQLNYLWFINQGAILKLDYSHLLAEMDSRDASTLVIATKISISDKLSLVLSFTDEYLEAQETVNRYTHDKTIFTSIQFDF